MLLCVAAHEHPIRVQYMFWLFLKLALKKLSSLG